MSDQQEEFTTPQDMLIREKLAEIYAAPTDPEYWSSLQLRILERISDSHPGLWWMFLGRWARAGIVAAAVALMAAGVASVVIDSDKASVAFQEVLEDRTPLTTLEIIAASPEMSDREAAFRYVFAYPER